MLSQQRVGCVLDVEVVEQNEVRGKRAWSALCRRHASRVWAHTRTHTTMSAALARSVVIVRPSSARVSQRWLSTTRVVREEAPNVGSVPPPKRPVGAFRGG